MSVDSDIGELFTRIAALEANPVGGSGIQFDTDPQVGDWLVVETIDRISKYGFPAGIQLLDSAGQNIQINSQGGELRLDAYEVTAIGRNDVLIRADGNRGTGGGIELLTTQDADILIDTTGTGSINITSLRNVELANGLGTGNVLMPNLPTSAPGVSNAVWNSSGTLKITP